MTNSNTIGRAVAIAAGISASTGALVLLCQDAIVSGNWTTTHFLLPLSIMLAIGFGWLVEHTARRRELVYAAFLLAPFALASALTVYQSIGAQKEKAAAKASSAEAHNQAIVDARAAIRRAENEQKASADMLRQANQDLHAQCVVGKKSKAHCNGIRATISVYTGAEKGHAQTVKELKADLERLGGERVARPRAEALGELAAVLGYDRKAVVAVASTLEPLSFPLLFELAAIISLGYGFRPTSHGRQQRAEMTREPRPALGHREVVSISGRVQTSFAGHNFAEAKRLLATNGNTESDPPKGGRKTKSLPQTLPANSKVRALPANVVPIRGKHPVISALELAGKPLSNEELAVIMCVSGGESTKRRREVADLIEQYRQGHRVMVGLKTWQCAMA